MFKTVAFCFGMLACAVAVGGVLDRPSVVQFDQSFTVLGGEAHLTCALRVAPAAAERRAPEHDPAAAPADSLAVPAP